LIEGRHDEVLTARSLHLLLVFEFARYSTGRKEVAVRLHA